MTTIDKLITSNYFGRQNKLRSPSTVALLNQHTPPLTQIEMSIPAVNKGVKFPIIY